MPHIKSKVKIYTNKPNLNPDILSNDEWLKEICRRKAHSFIKRLQNRLNGKTKKQSSNINPVICTEEELTVFLYNWCKRDVTCYFCGKSFLFIEDITINHVIPLSQKGDSLLTNLSPAHKKCNEQHGYITNPLRKL
jgi:5-methylcytosine-specific restriction endonuclease McrA